VKKSLNLWELEYVHGLTHEIYLISFKNDINKMYVNKPFIYAVQKMFRTWNILMIGIKSKNARESIQYDYHEIFMNPVDYMISEDDEAIVLARNQEETDLVF
jgi:hypothetical protein